MDWSNEPPLTNFVDKDGRKAVRHQLGFLTRR